MSDGAFSRLVDQEENAAETGIIDRQSRNYKLNKQKSQQKKDEATERANIQIVKKRGGLRVIFNAIIYELIKKSADKYYASKECKIVPVLEKEDNLVETQFKMKSGGQDSYTLNMYHTNYTCFVNGKQPTQFLEEDLPSILKTVELNLQQERVTIDEIIQRFQDIRLHCASFVSENQENVRDEHGNELKALASDVQNVRKKRQALNKKDTTNSDTHCDCLNSVKDHLTKINEAVEVLGNESQRHMKSTNKQIGEIKGNIVSLEKQYQVDSREVQSKVDTVSETAVKKKEKFEVVNVDLSSRKLPSISDTHEVSKSISSIQAPGKKKKMGQNSSEMTRIDETHNTSCRNDKSSFEKNPNGEMNDVGGYCNQPATIKTEKSTWRTSRTTSELDKTQNTTESAICPGTIPKSYPHKSSKLPSRNPTKKQPEGNEENIDY